MTSTDRRARFVRALMIIAAVLAVAGAAAVPAHARRTYSRTATVHRLVSVRLSSAATRSATRSYTAATDDHVAVTRTATVSITATASATGRGSATVRARATSTSPTRAYALARARAVTWATNRATRRARPRARARAYAAAAAAAANRAAAQALTKARTAALAAAKAASAPPVTPPPPSDPPPTDPPPTDPPPTDPGPPAAPCGGETPTTAGQTWTCTFDDEFDEGALNDADWSPITTSSIGFRNEPGCYIDSPDNISVSGGTLNLTTRAVDEPFTCHDPLHGDYSSQYTSGSVTTRGKFTQAYGRFSIRAKFSAATVAGLQSSLWLWPASNTYGAWPLSGELDIAEEYSVNADRAIPYLHYNYDPSSTLESLLSGNGLTGTNVATNNYCLIDDVNAFHTYTMTWAPGKVTIDFDGTTCLSDTYVPLGLLSPAPFDQQFFLNLTQGFGVDGNAFQPGSTPLPATTQIDYVRVWTQS